MSWKPVTYNGSYSLIQDWKHESLGIVCKLIIPHEDTKQQTTFQESFVLCYRAICDEKVNMPKLIMNQFRWLDRVVNSKVKLLTLIGDLSSTEQLSSILSCVVVVRCTTMKIGRAMRDHMRNTQINFHKDIFKIWQRYGVKIENNQLINNFYRK